ncbi:hypothetical protein COO72_12155 [Bifidobacterium callitrichos]|nr:hypothetical protein COO72_12155 [Bifidobacterium callitrichos]
MNCKEETTASAVALPLWAGDADVYAGEPDYDWTRTIRCTGGAPVADEPGGTTLTVILDRYDRLLRDGTTDTTVALHIDSSEDDTIPLQYAVRTAAAIIAMVRAYEHNCAEPTAEQVGDIEAQLNQLLDVEVVEEA